VIHRVRRIAAGAALSFLALGLSGLATSPTSAAPDGPKLVPPAPPATSVQLSQVSTQGPGGVADEFVELQNVQEMALDISSYTLWGCTQTGQQILLATIPQGTILQGTTVDPNVETGRYYLAANANGYSRTTPPDQLYTGDIQRLGGVLVRGVPTASNPQGAKIDAVGFSPANPCTETAPAPAQTMATPGGGSADQSVVRFGAIDTNINAFDFTLVSPAFPRNSSF